MFRTTKISKLKKPSKMKRILIYKFLYIPINFNKFNKMGQYFLGVVGGRDFTDYDLMTQTLDALIQAGHEYVLVSGGAKGADQLSEKYAETKGYDMIIYTPKWSQGKMAGPIRNQKIVDKSDEIVAFWDGKSPGTKSTIQIAKKCGKTVHVIKY